MLKIREAVIVEGRYDKIKLSSIVDAPIIETNGFRVFSDKEKQSLIRKIAETRGILIMTDSDGISLKARSIIQKLKIAIFRKSKARKNARQKAVKRGFWALKASAMRL